MSKLNYSYHRFLNNNRNKGIPNLMLWICIGNALVYFLSQFGTPLSLYSALSFDPQAIAHGQVWRLFSYIFTFAGIGDPFSVSPSRSTAPIGPPAIWSSSGAHCA